jgi:hypothetical protein
VSSLIFQPEKAVDHLVGGFYCFGELVSGSRRAGTYVNGPPIDERNAIKQIISSRRDEPSIAHPFMGGKRNHRNIFASRRDARDRRQIRQCVIYVRYYSSRRDAMLIAYPFMGGKCNQRNIFASRRDAMLIAHRFIGGETMVLKITSPVRDD